MSLCLWSKYTDFLCRVKYHIGVQANVAYTPCCEFLQSETSEEMKGVKGGLVLCLIFILSYYKSEVSEEVNMMKGLLE